MSIFTIVSTSHGMFIVNNRDSGVGNQLLLNKCHEPEVVNFGINLATRCFQLYGKGVTMVDVGANLGTCAVAWARHMHQWGFVQAYEPQETVFYALAGNLVMNNCMNARARNCVVTDFKGTMRIPQMNHNTIGNFGGLHLREDLAQPKSHDQPVSYKHEHTMPTEATYLDAEEFDRVDVLKVDVEGMEPEVLAGAKLTIAKFKPVLIVEFIHCGHELVTEPLKSDYEFFQLGGNVVCVPKTKPELVKFVTDNPPDRPFRT